MKWWFCPVMLFLSCNSNDTSKTNNNTNDSTTSVHGGATDTITHSTIALQDGCYAMMLQRDTATISIHIQDTVVTGNLNYRWAEKDRNKGSIKGFVKDSLLIADYTYESEGLTSVREVVFKLRGDTLLEGYGQFSDQNGKLVFKQKDHLKFNQATPFVKVDCQNLHP